MLQIANATHMGAVAAIPTGDGWFWARRREPLVEPARPEVVLVITSGGVTWVSRAGLRGPARLDEFEWLGPVLEPSTRDEAVSTLEAVRHQLRDGEASEGDVRDLEW